MVIKKADGTDLLTIDINEGALLRYELMKEHYIMLPFSLQAAVHDLRIGCFADTDYGRFIMANTQNTVRNANTDGFDYQLRLDAWYYIFMNKIAMFMPAQGSFETTFELTAGINTHLNVIKRTTDYLASRIPSGTPNPYRYYHNGTYTNVSFAVDDTVDTTVSKYIKYDSSYILDAFTQIAQAYDCEWWFEGGTVIFGKCERGTAVTFTHGDNVLMTSSGNRETYANRIYAFGSERNLPHNYREDPNNPISITNGIVQKRLMLPSSSCPYGYVQLNGYSEAEIVETIVVYEDIFPKVNCVVSDVQDYESTVQNEDGTSTTVKFYKVRDSGNFKVIGSDYNLILEGQTLKILFQSGSLNGMEFECNCAYHKAEGSNPDYDTYEIIANEDYGILLPNNTLKPSLNDRFVITGWDSTQSQVTGIIDAAEAELKAQADRELVKCSIDPNNYNCSYLADQNHTIYSLGQRVTLVNSAFFATSRLSRIIGYEIKLDIPYDHPLYIVGESVAYNRISTLENLIKGIGTNGDVMFAQAMNEMNSIKTYANLIVNNTYDKIQNQLDHQQITYFGTVTPTLSNAPASGWGTQQEPYSEHEGDMYYNKTDGRGYSFEVVGNTYGWVEITDQHAIEALRIASEQEDTIDGKRRTFVTPSGTLPQPPYDIGDLWVNATGTFTYEDNGQTVTVTYDNDILRCNVDKASGTAVITDWQRASKYTDDSAYNAFINYVTNGQGTSPNTAATAIYAIKHALDDGQTFTGGGLVLSNLIALGTGRIDLNTFVTWAGMNGVYDSRDENQGGAKGHGIAFWAGGGMNDGQVTGVTNGAKIVFRFDGSGYVAGGRISWDVNGIPSIDAAYVKVNGVDVITPSTGDTRYVTAYSGAADQTIYGKKIFNQVVFGNDFSGQSDKRMKDIIRDICLNVVDIAKSPSVMFKWKDKRDRKVHGGTLAQYWRKIAPWAVDKDDKGILSLSYPTLAFACAVEDAREIVRLKDEISELKKDIEELKRKGYDKG